MKIKNLLIAGITAFSIFIGTSSNVVAKENEIQEIDYESLYEVTEQCDYENPNYCGNNSLTNGLDSNQTTLFYMNSNSEGNFFLDPLADTDNVIFVGFDDMPELQDELLQGKRFIGTFTDTSLLELESLIEVFFE